MLRVRYVCSVDFFLGLGAWQLWEVTQRLALRRQQLLGHALGGEGGAAVIAGASGVTSQLSGQCWIVCCLMVECRASGDATVGDGRLPGGGEAARHGCW